MIYICHSHSRNELRNKKVALQLMRKQISYFSGTLFCLKVCNNVNLICSNPPKSFVEEEVLHFIYPSFKFNSSYSMNSYWSNSLVAFQFMRITRTICEAHQGFRSLAFFDINIDTKNFKTTGLARTIPKQPYATQSMIFQQTGEVIIP